MPRVQFYHAVRFNLSGYDRLPHVFDEGEQEVPERVGEFVRRNPSVGAVIEAPAAPESPPPMPSASAEEEAEAEAPGFSGLTVPQLRERARAVGIEGAGALRKDELIEALASAEDAEDEA